MPLPLETEIASADAAAEKLAAEQRAAAEKAEIQARSSNSPNPGTDVKLDLKPTSDAEDNLDRLFTEASSKPPPDGLDLGRENAGVRPDLEGKPEVDETAAKAAAEKAAAEKAAADAEKAKAATGKEPVEGAKPKTVLDDLLADVKPATDKAAPKAEDNPYEAVKLRADASPKTRETFDNLKKVAQEREQAALSRASEVERQLVELRTQFEALQKNPVPEELRKELAELRGFRAQFDTQSDPAFKQKYDSRIEHNYEAVYSRLQFYGLKPEVVAELKAMPREQRDATIDGWLEKLPSAGKLFISAKLADNINVQEAREAELQEVRAKADQILADKAKAPAQQAEQRVQAIVGELRPHVERIDWLHPKEIPSTAGAEERKALEAWNAFATEQAGRLQEAIVSDDPRTRATAALAVPLAAYFKRELVAALEKLDEATKELDKIKSASALSRASRSVASAVPPSAAKALPKDEDRGDTFDALYKEIQGGAPGR